MKLRSGEIYYPRANDTAIMASLDQAVSDPGIVIVYGPGGSGKTALIEQWKQRDHKVVRPDEIIHVYLSDKTPEYRSSTHMIYDRTIEAIDQHHPPAYVPMRKKDIDKEPISRFGKKNLESLRQKVRQKVEENFIRVIVLDNVQYATRQAIITAIFQLGCTGGDQEMKRTFILVGQEEKKWLNWMLDNESIKKFILDVYEMGPLSLDEYKPAIRYLRDEGLKAIVPDNELTAEVNQELGKLVEATEGNWASLTRLLRLMDQEMKPQPDDSRRHITLEVLSRVRQRVRMSSR